MSLQLNIVGDLSFSHFKTDSIEFDNSIETLLETSDFNIANLENPICNTDSLQEKPKPIVLQSTSLPLKVLKYFNAFSLANNHIFDFYTNGYKQTIEYLNFNNKLYFGAGNSNTEAEKPLLFHKKNIKVAVWGMTRFDNSSKSQSGTATDLPKKYRKQISILKQDGYFIVFYCHWGREYIDYPTPDDRHVARSLIDYEADCVIGTHPHVLQGYENYKGKCIFYSLGNFIFSEDIAYSVAENAKDPRLNFGYIINLSIEENHTYTASIIPYYTNNGTIRKCNDTELKQFNNHIKCISETLQNEKEYVQEFYNHATAIRTQSKKMIKKQMKQHGIQSLIQALFQVRMQDLRIAFYPNFEKRYPILKGDSFIARFYSVFLHKFLTFSIVGLVVTITTMFTMGFLLGIVKLPLFPTWWIVYLCSIFISLLLNNKLIFKGNITAKKIFLFFMVYISSMFLGIYIIKFLRETTSYPNWLLGYFALPFTITFNFFFINKIMSKKTIDSNIFHENKIYITTL